MRAYELQQFGIDNLALVERDIPVPGRNEVLVKLSAVSLNYRDVMVVTGTYNPRMKMPMIPFSDGAGEVIAVGDGVTKWLVGDRVMPIFAQDWHEGGLTDAKRRTALGSGPKWEGTLREYAAFNEEGLVAIPSNLSYEEAATLPCAAVTAWNALMVSGRLQAGQSVLTLGTGGVSIFALQFAKLAGARVISTSSSDEKLLKLKDLGSDEVINYRTSENWAAAIMELTAKNGVDHVVEVGGSGTLGNSVRSARIGGHVALIGALAEVADFNPVEAFMKAIRLQGIFVGSRQSFENMINAIQVNRLKPVIDKVFDFEDARGALRYMESGSHFGKIVIKL